MHNVFRNTRFVMIAFIMMMMQQQVHAQYTPAPDTSLSQHITFYQPKPVTTRSFIMPVGLIAVGALSHADRLNAETKEERDEHFTNFHTSIDSYLQYAPVVAGYAMLINNPQHNVWKYTEKLLLSEAIMTGLVYSTKSIVKEPRPDTDAPNSFPSGHTAQAFVSATIFCDEFAQHKPWLCAGVYTGAAAVGALRIMNNRHWAGDVIAGAGFGILSAKLSEWIIEPHKKINTLETKF